MKKFLLAMCIAMAAVMVVAPAYAVELWEPHYPGSGEGLASGALPPPGFYFVNYMTFPQFKVYDENSNVTAKLNGIVDIPVLLWSTGLKFLGASYGMAIAQPWDMTSLRLGTTGELPSANVWGAYNTVFIPYILSWKVCDFRIKTSLAIEANDGTSSPGDAVQGTILVGKDGNVYAWSSNNNWSFIPELGISWLYHGWNASIDLQYAIQTKDTYNQYQSGDLLEIDYTLTYTYKKWTFGVGAETVNQIGNDTQNGVVVDGGLGKKEQKYNVGPLLGYNFGPCSIMLIYDFDCGTKNAPNGEQFAFRFVVPLGNPCPLGGK